MKAVKLHSAELKGTAVSRDNSLWVRHYIPSPSTFCLELIQIRILHVHHYSTSVNDPS